MEEIARNSKNGGGGEGRKNGERVVEGHMISSSCSPSETLGHMGKKVIYTKTQRIPILFPSRYLIEGLDNKSATETGFQNFFPPFLLVLTVY